MSEAKPTFRQVLTDRRLLAVLLMSFASGLPFNLTSFTLQAWLASEGISLKEIGLATLVGLPYLFKFFWAPLLDRYLPPLLGRRRGWILIYQVALAIAIGAMGFCSPSKTLFALEAIAVLVALLSASQDIVIDAYRVDIIPPAERALAAPLTAFGYRTAATLAGSVLVLIAAHTSWRLAFLMVAACMLLTVFSTLWAPEPQAPGKPPRTLVDAVWLPLKDLCSQRGAWGFLPLVFLYKFGDAFALSLYSTFMIKGMGFSLDELSIAGKVNMTISSMIGVSIGGIAYLRLGMFRSMLIFGIAQALTNLLYMALAVHGKSIALLVLSTTVDTMVGGMGLAAFTGFLISLCNVNFSATQYALLSALASIPSRTTGALAAQVVPIIGWDKFFIVTCLCATPGVLLLVAQRRAVNALASRDAKA